MSAHPVSGRLELPANIQRESVSGLGDVETHVCAFVIDTSASKAGEADVNAEGLILWKMSDLQSTQHP